MKTYKLLLLSLSVFCFTACEKELDRDLTDANVSVATDENVRYEGNILTVKKGTPITFLLHGDPDYVSFFSGELGHQYVYRDRKEYSAEDVESCELKFGIWTATGNANSCTNQLDVFYMAEEQAPNLETTTFFPGMSKTDFEADSILVEKTTEWKALISREELPNKVLGSAASALNYSRSVKEFIGKKFTLAIVLNKDGKKASDYPTYSDGTPIPQSTFNFTGMRVETTWRNGRVTTAYASSFGFTPLNMKNKTVFKDQDEINMPKDREYGSVSTGVSGMWNLSSIANGGFTVTGAASGFDWKYTWLVSDYLNFLECPEPDLPVKVKDVSLDVDTYSYTYDQVGTYTATFLMNNFSYAHEASKICELIINVTE